MQPITMVRIYTGADGETHFEDVALVTEVGAFGSAGSLSAVAAAIPVTAVTIREVREEGPVSGVWHCNPRRRLDVFLAGLCEVEASDGEVRRFGDGAAQILLGEDLTGRGHLFRPLAGPRVTLFVDLPDGWTPCG